MTDTPGTVVTAKGMTPEQLARIEEKAIERYKHMHAIHSNAGNISLALAALMIEVCSEARKNDTKVFVIAQDDIRGILKSYLREWKLTPAFPYKNAQLLDYTLHSDLGRLGAFVG